MPLMCILNKYLKQTKQTSNAGRKDVALTLVGDFIGFTFNDFCAPGAKILKHNEIIQYT